jgi:pyrimidine-nucleoside phosphorylase
VLEGGGDEDIKNITRELAAKMISLSCGYEIEKARELVDEAIRSGAAIKKFKEWVIAQGADKDKLDDGTYLPIAKNKVSVLARADGYISKMDTEKIGICACMTGAGRESKSDVIDLSAGIEILAKTGDYVKAGDELAIIYTAKENTDSMIDTYLSALEFSSEKVDYPTLIYDVLG